jgi:anti-sigma B factor antagonist
MAEQDLVVFKQAGPIVVGTIQSNSVLDAMNVTEFGDCVRNYVEEHPGGHLLLDFSRVDYLSSAVLTELLRVNDKVLAHGGTLRLCGLNADIRKVFEITNLDKVFTIYGELKPAIDRYLRSLDIAAKEESWDHLA